MSGPGGIGVGGKPDTSGTKKPSQLDHGMAAFGFSSMGARKLAWLVFSFFFPILKCTAAVQIVFSQH